MLDGWDFRLLRSLVERVPLEPNSVWAAKKRGGIEYFGWGPAEYQNANLIDAINLQTAVIQVHGSKKKPKVPEGSYRPGTKDKNTREVRPKSIKEMKSFTL